jgi:hypothetical protein
MLLLRFSMQALGSVPHMSSRQVFNSKCMLILNGWFALSKILRFPEHVLSDSFMIFHCLLNDDGLWESGFEPLIVNGHSCTIKQPLFSISEPMLSGIDLPIVVSSFLLSGGKVTVSLCIHLSVLFTVIIIILGIKHFFGVLTVESGNTKGELFSCSLSYLFRPFVTSLIASTQRFLHLRSVFALLYIVKFIS